MPHPRFTSDEIAERGQALYDSRIRDDLAADDRGKFLVLDIETGEYEIDRNELAALKRSRARRPEGAFYILRIGYPAAYRLGRQALAAAPC